VDLQSLMHTHIGHSISSQDLAHSNGGERRGGTLAHLFIPECKEWAKGVRKKEGGGSPPYPLVGQPPKGVGQAHSNAPLMALSDLTVGAELLRTEPLVQAGASVCSPETHV
jgi:hypothetical protein